jgi:multiple sugar transport system permease protein
VKTAKKPLNKISSRKYLTQTKIEPYFYVSPTVLLLIILMVIPVYLVFSYTFKDNVILNQNPIFVGFKNYKAIIADPNFIVAIKNTVFFTAGSVIAHLLIGLIFASILNSENLSTTARAFFRIIFILPWLFTVAIIAIVWRMLLNPYGVINYLISLLNLNNEPIQFLSDERTALIVVTLINIWAGYPFYMISLLAGLQGIPKDLHEAATVDGVNSMQRFKNVTLPQLKPLIIGMSILDVIWTSQQFAIIWMTTGGGPINATEMLGTYTYKLAFSNFQFSLASTSAVFLFLISMLLAFLYNFSQRERKS